MEKETTLQRLERLKSYLDKPELESLQMSLDNVHAKGMFSLVIHGTEPGKLVRVFIAGKKLNPFEVQYHNHRYSIHLTTLKGNIIHHTATADPYGNIMISAYNYKSFLMGGNGLTYIEERQIRCDDYRIPIGSTIVLSHESFHTMSVSKGSMWVVEETGFKKDDSEILGVPFVVDGLYTKPEMFQINDGAQLVLTELKRLIGLYTPCTAIQ